MFQVGDYVVKVNNGVCCVQDIVEMNGPGAKGKKYYLMVPREDKNAKLYVPVDGKNDNVRNVMSEEEAKAFLQRIQGIESASISSEKMREQRYKDAIRSGSPDQLISILKNIYSRNLMRSAQGKKNTIVDERYFRLAENILFSELSFALNQEKDAVEKLVESIYSE